MAKPSEPMQQFIRMVSETAQRLGVQHVMLALRDPITREAHVVASPGTYDDLRAAVEIKLGGGGESEWS